MLAAGYRKAYAPQGAVRHSNDMGVREYAARMFDETLGLRRVGQAVPRYSAPGAVLRALRGSLVDTGRILRDHDYGLGERLRWIVVNPAYHFARWDGLYHGARVDLADEAAHRAPLVGGASARDQVIRAFSQPGIMPRRRNRPCTVPVVMASTCATRCGPLTIETIMPPISRLSTASHPSRSARQVAQDEVDVVARDVVAPERRVVLVGRDAARLAMTQGHAERAQLGAASDGVADVGAPRDGDAEAVVADAQAVLRVDAVDDESLVEQADRLEALRG